MEQIRAYQIYLDPQGHGGEYRYKNAPGEVQRPHLIDRGGSLQVLADLSEVVHGRLTPDGEPATIIVTDFEFVPSKTSRRFKTASITLRFESADSSVNDVEVSDIAPRGHYSLNRTTKHVELTRTTNASIQGGTVVSANAGFGWELKEAQDIEDQTSLSGTIRLEGRDFGGKNTARWTMSENRAQNSGIPTFLRTVTRLRRRQRKPGPIVCFNAVIEIKCSVDFASAVEENRDRLFGRIHEDDPVIFDPLQRPTTTEFDGQRLASYDLKAYSAIIETIWC